MGETQNRSKEFKKDYPRVAIVVLNWNNYEDTAECLSSLANLEYPEYRPIVVDNGSEDGSGEKLQEEFSWCEFVFNEENLGFAGGCNQGIEKAIDTADYTLLLNNDCRFRTSGSLRSAVEVAEKRPDTGIIGGKIYYSGSKKIWSACGEINWLRGRGVHYGHNELDTGNYDEITEVDFVSGALMLINNEVIKDVGPLPEEFFFGAEEWDYSVKVRRAGYSLYYCPQFEVDHEVGASHDTFDLGFIYNTYRNKLLFQRRNLSTVTWYLWALLFFIYYKTLLRFNLQKQISSSDEEANIDEVMDAIGTAISDHVSGQTSVSKEAIEQFGEL